MKILAWNARGLGNPRDIRHLCDLLKKEAPDVVFLEETRLSARVVESCKFKFGFQNCLAVSTNGRKGGIALYWGRDVALSIINYSFIHFDVVVSDDSVVGGHWFLTAIYGLPETHLCSRTWSLLRSLRRSNGDAWLVLGDLNETMFHHEKQGGNPKPDSQIAAFRDVVEECELRDLGFSGYKFTWSNRREGHAYVNEQLDRFLANSSWWNFYPQAKVIHGLVAYSDHLPIWIELEGDTGIPVKKKKLFRFEEMWIGNSQCEAIIKDQWRMGHAHSSMKEVEGMIRESGVKLQLWNSNCFGHVQKKLQKSKSPLETCL
ncbi:uncharacterized protein LOC122296722 [Carya illinoinensis]|uniref:uncharacterized protein LOC122296722 n=1 Tax=Carya illinoinensis TaxID=32201 RepID=UPI001C724639|nr:uncharacterized protein LOC122296722 [Carya illinoinensis]